MCIRVPARLFQLYTLLMRKVLVRPAIVACKFFGSLLLACDRAILELRCARREGGT